MTLRLDPAMLEAGYEFLRTTPPFRAWKLPHADEIAFHIIRSKDRAGDFDIAGGVPTIRVSESCIGHTGSLLALLAHEMIHLRQHMIGDRTVHGAKFQAMARRCCAAHGFDPKTFS